MGKSSKKARAIEERADRTREFYQSRAEEYAARTLDFELSRPWELARRYFAAGSRVLDLGCGAGRDLRFFLSEGMSPIGLDYSTPLLRIARAHSHALVVAGDLRALPCRERSFDAVWAIASLLHLPRTELSTALTEIHRVLEPQGILIATIQRGQGERIGRGGRLFSRYEPEEWNTTLERCGLELRNLYSDFDESVGLPEPVEWLVSVVCRSSRRR